MTAKTHNVGAVLAGLTVHQAVFEKADLLMTGIFFGSCLISSTLADISHPESRVGRRIRPVSAWIYHHVGHRGATHCLISLAVLILIPLIGIIFDVEHMFWGGLGFFIGQATHIILDLLNEPGVALFFPKEKRYRLLKLKTGGLGEYLILFLMLGLIIWLLSDVTIYWYERFLENLSQFFFFEYLIN